MHLLVKVPKGKKFKTEPYDSRWLKDETWIVELRDLKSMNIWLAENKDIIKWKKAI